MITAQISTKADFLLTSERKRRRIRQAGDHALLWRNEVPALHDPQRIPEVPIRSRGAALRGSHNSHISSAYQVAKVQPRPSLTSILPTEGDLHDSTRWRR